MKKIPDIAYTHSGIFHCDDVFSTALLKLINPNIKVYRISDLNEIKTTEDYLVYDIGLGKYDHHQENKKIRPDGTPYAAFGLLWEEFGELLIQNEKAKENFDTQFIKTLDKSDNSNQYNSLCDAIGSFNQNKEDNSDFFEAVKFAKRILKNKINKINYIEDMKMEIKSKITDNQIIYISNKYINPSVFEKTNIKIMIYPSNRIGYHVQITNKNYELNLKNTNKNIIKEQYPDFLYNQSNYLFVFQTKESAVNFANEIKYCIK